MSARLVAPGGLLEVRTLALNHIAPGEVRTFDLELLAGELCLSAALVRRDSMAALGNLAVSTDGGATWHVVPAAGAGAITGPDCGPLTAGQRKAIKVRLTLPEVLAGVILARSRSIGLVLGLGI